MNRLRTLRRIMRTVSGAFGVIVFGLLLAVAFLGPLIAPHPVGEIVGLSSQSSTSGLPLGTDYLGRDVLSRLLDGGRSVVLIGFSATVIAYLIGTVIGIYAGYRGGLRDSVTMRAMDLLLTIPGILVLLLLAGALGRSTWVVAAGVVYIQFPAISRVTRTATQSIAKMSYVEAAQARGDGTFTICRRDVLPNIAPNLLADFGVRFSVSILMVAGLNYLGLGLAPPAADWGLMTSENQATLSANVWAVVAPALLLALLGVSINLIADAYTRVVGRSGVVGRSRRRTNRPDLPVPPLAVAAASPSAGPALSPSSREDLQ